MIGDVVSRLLPLCGTWQTDLVLANREMRENLTSAARTTMRLSLMFLRMRQTKQRAERRSRYHSEVCADLEASIRQQAGLVKQMRRSPSDSEASALLFDAQHRISQLVQQNASLQLRLASALAARGRRRSCNRPPSQRTMRRLLRRLAKELCYETGMPDADDADDGRRRRRSVVFGRRRITRKLHAHIAADSDVTVFDAEFHS